MWIVTLLIFVRRAYSTEVSDHKRQSWLLPIIPVNFNQICDDSFNLIQNQINKTDASNVTSKIPKNLWMAFREVPPIDKIPKHTAELLDGARKDGWAINLIDGDAAEDKFMATYFANTSIHWAYNMIGPASVVSKVDIWRYCALYAFGGLYIDDDSFIGAPLSKIFNASDEMVMATENNEYAYHCWKPEFYLSNDYLSSHYNSSKYLNYFYNCNLVNWAIFVSPRNPILFEVMKNIVEVIQLEYFEKSVIILRTNVQQRGKKKRDDNFKRIICATGPAMMTATIRKMLLLYDLKSKDSTIDVNAPFPFRLTATDDFSEFGGRWKANLDAPFSQKKKYRHYSEVFNEHNPSYLRHYYNSTFEETHVVDYDKHNQTWSLKVLLGT